MSTATEPRRPATEARNSTAKPILDDVVRETEGRRGSVIKGAAHVLGVPPEKLCGLLRNVWAVSKGQPPLTDQEMFVGISMIARYELDPIAREVYVTRDNKGRLMTIIGIDGWIKILDRTEHYDGFEVELKEDEHGSIVWCETKIHSKTRKYPACYRAYAREYANLAGFMATKIPSHMLRIFSLRHAARLFVPLSGTVVTEEEAGWMLRQQDETPKAESELDALTDRLMQPVTQHADEGAIDAPADIAPAKSSSPSAIDSAWAAFTRELADAVTVIDAQGSCDKWFGPDSTVEFTSEQYTEARRLVMERQEAIRGNRGTRSNQKQLAGT